MDNIKSLIPSKRIRVAFGKVLFLFYLVTLGSQSNLLLSDNLRNFIIENRFAQHLLGFLILFTLMINYTSIIEPTKALFYTSLTYFFFILTTKMSLGWNLLIVAMAVFGYFYEQELTYIENRLKEDENVSDEIKKEQKLKHNQLFTGFVALMVAIVVLGTTFYMDKKVNQYGGNFSLDKFFFANKNINV